MKRSLWLVLGVVSATACQSRGIVPGLGVAGDSADQVMETMEFTVNKDGIKTSTIQADSAWVYQARLVVDLKGVTMTFYDPNGNVKSTVTANTGVYLNRDGTLDARGNVIAVATDGKTLKTEHLVFDRTANMIRSDTFYTFTSPQGEGSGMGFITDPDFRKLESFQVRGRQKGEGFVLPGQTTGTRP